MDNPAYNNERNHVLSGKDFDRLSHFIYEELGIKMPNAKKTMLEARLQKRLRALNIPSFKDYCEYLFSPQGVAGEMVQMIDLVTTNKTDFFREPEHFDYLLNKVLPEWSQKHRGQKLMVWSAGCSSGEEPYTLAMVLSEFGETCPGFRFEILATDISTRVLEKAKLAVYPEERVIPVPLALKKKYLLRSKDKIDPKVRIAPILRDRVRFRRLNFMDGDFNMREPLDIIFCRNVVIYFDRQTQEKLLNHFYMHMAPDGYIFMGHSETLSGLNVPLTGVHPTVYRKLK